jgi:hypothetical protein
MIVVFGNHRPAIVEIGHPLFLAENGKVTQNQNPLQNVSDVAAHAAFAAAALEDDHHHDDCIDGKNLKKHRRMTRSQESLNFSEIQRE